MCTQASRTPRPRRSAAPARRASRAYFRYRGYLGGREVAVERVAALPAGNQVHRLSFAPEQARDDRGRPLTAARTKQAHERVFGLLRGESRARPRSLRLAQDLD